MNLVVEPSGSTEFIPSEYVNMVSFTCILIAHPENGSLDITFTLQDLPMNKEPCTLYIPAHINKNIVTGVLVDLVSRVNIIIEETLIIKFLHREEYKNLKIMIHTHDGLSVPPLDSITLLVFVGPRAIDTSFDIILESNLFRVKLGILWLVSMNGITLVIHNVLSFLMRALCMLCTTPVINQWCRVGDSR